MDNWKQMELFPSTLSREDILANRSPLQVANVVKKIKDISGLKCLDLSRNVNRLGSLEKTLVDTLNSVLTPYLRTWRVKVTPRGRLVFQLVASVPTTKENESGLWLTPSATQINERSEESMRKRKEYRTSIGRTTVTPGNLAEQVQYGKPVTNMVPTPTARDYKDSGPNVNYEKARKKRRLAGSAGGSLNPTWVEWLMGYPKGWTDLKD